MTERRSLPRRRYLASAGVLGVASLGGCLDERLPGDGPDDNATDRTDRSDRNGTEPDDSAEATDDVETTDEDTESDGGDLDNDDGTDSTDDADGDGDDPDGDSGSDDGDPDDDTERIHADYETTEVRVTTPDGDELGSVTAAIADTGGLRWTGLSDTPHLPEDRGMLFVYDEPSDDLTFVMREMDFGIDIVYADAEGVITGIHHAPEPGPDEDGEDHRYPGYGQYVLEVVYEWTADRGVETGDVLAFEL